MEFYKFFALHFFANDLYPLISKNIVRTHFQFLFTFKLLLSETTGILKKSFWDHKIYFELSVVVPENSLWDTSSLRWTSASRYQELTVLYWI